MASMRVEINPHIIKQALARVNRKAEDFPQAKSWLSGKKKPTLKQLAEFSKKVHIPLGYLFLDRLPEEEIPIPYFRTEGGSEVSLEIIDTIKLLKNRQEWLSYYLKEKGYDSLPFVGKFKDTSDVKKIVEDIRKTLQLPEVWASEFKSWEETLERLTEIVEEIGIVIVFNSIVGNNSHRKILVEDCRGFVLIDNYAPFMFINSADAKSAQMFTIAHELAHIWIGQSAGFNLRRLLPAEDPMEKLCDKIAAEFLVPEEIFREKWREWRDFQKVAQFFKVSQIVIARRALDLGEITKEEFFEFYDKYKEAPKKREEGGGDFYYLQKRRLGLRFMKFVHQAVKEGKLLYRDAYLLTGLFGKSYHKFIAKFYYG